MNLVTQFVIDDQHYIEVLVPPFGEKENSFCDPTPLLHNCDFVTAYLVTTTTRVVVYKDILQSFLWRTIGMLINMQNNRLELPDNIEPGTIGYLYNIETHGASRDSLNYLHYWLWTTNKANGRAQSWIYSKDKIVYLEVASSYEWLNIEPPIEDDQELFQKFLDNYKPILCTELSAVTVKNWIDQCKYLDKTIDRPYKRKS